MDRRALVALALAASACTGPMPAAKPPAGPPASSAPPAAPSPVVTDPSPGPRVARELRFNAPLLEGGRFRGRAYAGRDVALWFWAPW